jgi:hypothetical protein
MERLNLKKLNEVEAKGQYHAGVSWKIWMQRWKLRENIKNFSQRESRLL